VADHSDCGIESPTKTSPKKQCSKSFQPRVIWVPAARIHVIGFHFLKLSSCRIKSNAESNADDKTEESKLCDIERLLFLSGLSSDQGGFPRVVGMYVVSHCMVSPDFLFQTNIASSFPSKLGIATRQNISQPGMAFSKYSSTVQSLNPVYLFVF
jgi:hypothetical protein